MTEKKQLAERRLINFNWFIRTLFVISTAESFNAVWTKDHFDRNTIRLNAVRPKVHFTEMLLDRNIIFIKKSFYRIYFWQKKVIWPKAFLARVYLTEWSFERKRFFRKKVIWPQAFCEKKIIEILFLVYLPNFFVASYPLLFGKETFSSCKFRVKYLFNMALCGDEDIWIIMVFFGQMTFWSNNIAIKWFLFQNQLLVNCSFSIFFSVKFWHFSVKCSFVQTAFG
jgi:hypothetical protein